MKLSVYWSPTSSPSVPVDQLLADAVTTDDDPPLHTGPPEKKRKPRHPPKVSLLLPKTTLTSPACQPPSDAVGVDLSHRSVLLFPGQGAQFVGMGKQVALLPRLLPPPGALHPLGQSAVRGGLPDLRLRLASPVSGGAAGSPQ